MEEQTLEEETDIRREIVDDINNLPNRVVKIAGATASIAIITMILYAFRIIPSSVSLAIGFFVSLPLIYSFAFGIIFNKPNFNNVLRHYSFLAYIIIALIIYMIVLKPDSLILGIKYIFHFILAFFFAVIGYFFYSLTYRIFIKFKYRWKALIGFGVSFAITFIISSVLKHYGIFELIKV